MTYPVSPLWVVVAPGKWRCPVCGTVKITRNRGLHEHGCRHVRPEVWAAQLAVAIAMADVRNQQKPSPEESR